MKNSQKGFIVPLLTAIIVLLVVGGISYIYLNKNSKTSDVSNNTVATSTKINSYTQNVFGIKFDFPESINSVKSNFSSQYYYGESEISEERAIELLNASGTGAGWNANLFNNCSNRNTPYCFGIGIGIWPKSTNAEFKNEIINLGDEEHKVYLQSNEYNPGNDTIKNFTSGTRYTSYLVVNNSRNLTVSISFLTGKSQIEPLTDTQIKEEESLYNYLKNTIVPDIIKSIKDTNTKKFLLREEPLIDAIP